MVCSMNFEKFFCIIISATSVKKEARLPVDVWLPFLTGGPGSGKSFIVKNVLYQSLTRLSKEDNSHLNQDVSMPTVCNVAYCVLAARQHRGSTVHSQLVWNFSSTPSCVHQFTEITCQNYRIKMSHLKVLLID